MHWRTKLRWGSHMSSPTLLLAAFGIGFYGMATFSRSAFIFVMVCAVCYGIGLLLERQGYKAQKKWRAEHSSVEHIRGAVEGRVRLGEDIILFGMSFWLEALYHFPALNPREFSSKDLERVTREHMSGEVWGWRGAVVLLGFGYLYYDPLKNKLGFTDLFYEKFVWPYWERREEEARKGEALLST